MHAFPPRLASCPEHAALPTAVSLVIYAYLLSESNPGMLWEPVHTQHRLSSRSSAYDGAPGLMLTTPLQNELAIGPVSLDSGLLHMSLCSLCPSPFQLNQPIVTMLNCRTLQNWRFLFLLSLIDGKNIRVFICSLLYMTRGHSLLLFYVDHCFVLLMCVYYVSAVPIERGKKKTWIPRTQVIGS